MWWSDFTCIYRSYPSIYFSLYIVLFYLFLPLHCLIYVLPYSVLWYFACTYFILYIVSNDENKDVQSINTLNSVHNQIHSNRSEIEFAINLTKLAANFSALECLRMASSVEMMVIKANARSHSRESSLKFPPLKMDNLRLYLFHSIWWNSHS